MIGDGIKAAQNKLEAMRKAGTLKPRTLVRRRDAINAYCKQCMGGKKNPGVPAMVRNCEITHCPIHPGRPYQKTPTGPQSLKTLVQEACFECVGRMTDPAPKQRVRDCKVTDCALHSIRPWQNIGNGGKELGEKSNLNEAHKAGYSIFEPIAAKPMPR